MSRGAADLEDRLANWGRAMRIRSAQGRAMSFEGQYRSPQHWEALPSRINGAIDSLDAWRIEAAWGSLPLLARIVLRGHYCLQWTAQHICRIATKQARIVCNSSQIDHLLKLSRAELEMALDRSESQNRNILRRAAQKLLDIVGLAHLNAR